MRSQLSALRLGSLKVRLTLASVALILVSVALTVHFTLREVRQGSERIVLESREDDARRLAAIVSRRLVALQRALRAAETTLPRAALDEPTAAVAYLERNAVLRTMFSAVFVVAADGRVLAFSDGQGTRDTPMSFADRDYFRNTMAAKRPLISNALMSRVSGEPIVVFTMPITGGAGETAGVLGGSLRLSSRSLLDDLTQASEDHDFPASTIVTDATGQIIAHPSNEWLLRNAESAAPFDPYPCILLSLVLSCLADVTTKVDCLELGAQDYLTKPFSLAELLARVRVRLRDDAHPLNEVLRAGDLVLDVGRLEANIGGGPVALTRLEFLLLRELMEHAGQSVGKGQLLASVWGYDFDPGSNVVDVCVRRLRSKLGFELIKTVRGEGYRLAS